MVVEKGSRAWRVCAGAVLGGLVVFGLIGMAVCGLGLALIGFLLAWAIPSGEGKRVAVSGGKAVGLTIASLVLMVGLVSGLGRVSGIMAEQRAAETRRAGMVSTYCEQADEYEKKAEAAR